MKRGLFLVVLGLGVLSGEAAAQAPHKTKSEEAFDRLASLVGEWRGERNGVEINLIYTLTADGSALMEEFRPKSGPVMITMFTVDGDHLLATHYCSAKNQPQMKTAPITEVRKELAFSLARVTGLKTPEDWHNTGLTVIQEDDEHLTQEWTYQFQGESGRTTFHFMRVRPAN